MENENKTENIVPQTAEPQPQIPVQTLTPPLKPKKAWKKWILIILILILVLSLPLGGYLLLGKMGIHPKSSTITLKYTQSPTPVQELLNASDWITYTDLHYGFSFKYPKNWTTIKWGVIGLVPKDKLPYFSQIAPPIYVKTEENPTNLTLEKWQEEKNSKIMGIPYNFYNSKTITTKINSYTAYVNSKGDSCDPFYCNEIFIMSPGRIIIFKNVEESGQLPTENNQFKEIFTKADIQTNQQIFNTILSTLKLTDQSPQPDISSWKTFTGNGFSFRYPSNFSSSNSTYYSLLNHDILIENAFSSTSALQCRGDCPLIDDYETKTINNIPINIIKGTIGVVGGNIPQSYVTYELMNTSTKKYLNITLYELPKDNMNQDYSLERTPEPISNGKIYILEQILQTFKFNNQTSAAPTCTPRPKCLDSNPRCMIAETSDMCPATTLTPSK